MDNRPNFLRLPDRSVKPRTIGLTHVLDKGVPLLEVESVTGKANEYIDIWKLGWGTAYLDSELSEKLDRLHERGIQACVGGTLLEAAWLQRREADCLDWAAEVGVPCVEVSNGAAGMPMRDKRRLIQEAARRFVVISEVGSKDPSAPVSAFEWADEIAGDLEAGARWVLTEGRESGTVGLYSHDGRVREDLVAGLVDRVGVAPVVFEAPRKEQQAWFVRRFGPNVSLGNVPPDEVIGLESLRLGLRADTLPVPEGVAKAQVRP